MNYRSRIVGTGSWFPERVMTNQEFEAFIDTSDEWIRTRTGIETRRVADQEKGETTAGLSLKAAQRALQMADVKGEEIELIVVGTVTPDTVMPTVANTLQAQLGAKRAFSFDLQAACSGFLYSLSIADQYIRSGTVKSALVLGAETLSTITNYKDRGTCVLFGDGAGAVVLQRSTDDKHGVIGTKLFSDGCGAEMLCIPHGYSKVPPYHRDYRQDLHKIHMQGSEVFKNAVRNMNDAAHQVMRDNDVTVEDLDFVFVHQANSRIIELCLKQLGVPAEKSWTNVAKYGNTSAATLPVCLDEAWRAGAVKPGDLVLMATFGGGLTWGSSLIRL